MTIETPLLTLNNGVRIPAIGLGVFQSSPDETVIAVEYAIDQGYRLIPKSTKPERITENFEIFDFELSNDQIAAIDALDIGVLGGPEPDSITLETFRGTFLKRERRLRATYWLRCLQGGSAHWTISAAG